LSAPPDALAAIGVPTSKGGREGKGKREGRDRKREGMEGEGRLASHTILSPDILDERGRYAGWKMQSCYT